MINCPRCDSRVPDGAKFCFKCGEPTGRRQAAAIQDAQPNICPRCGTENPPEARFCKKDGFRLSKGGNAISTPFSPMPDVPPLVVPQEESTEQNVPVPPLEEKLAHAMIFPGAKGKATERGKKYKRSRSLFFPGLILLFVVIGVLSGWYFFVRERPVLLTPPQNKAAVAAEEKPANTPVEQPTQPAEPPPPASAALSTPPAPATEDDPMELEKIINNELKTKGIGAVSVKISRDMTGIARGEVRDEHIKARALKLMAAHEGLRSISDKIVVKSGEHPGGPVRVQGELNRALKKAGLGSVTAEVNSSFGVTLKGTVQNIQGRNKALSVARSFKDLKGLKDVIFVVAP